MCRWLLASALLVACVSSDPLEPDGSLVGGGGSGYGGFSNSGGETPIGGFGGDVGSGGFGGEPSNGGGPACGDGACNGIEDCITCPADCSCAGVCGDGTCEQSEDCASCEEDCGVCANCGDGTCDANEDCDVCPDDCGTCSCSADNFEGNNGSGSATPVSFNVDYCNLSVCSGDFDWFAFNIVNGFSATLTFAQVDGDLDLEIYSSLTNDYVTGSYSADSNEEATASGLPAGKYWARVYGKGGAENFDYCLRVEP